MLKRSFILSILGVVFSCSTVMSSAFDASTKKLVEDKHHSDKQEKNKLPSAEEVTQFFYDQMRDLSIFAEPVNAPYSKDQPVNFLNRLFNYSRKEPASKYRASKIFEVGMDMALSSKVSCGAEVSISKNKNNFGTESKAKSPTTGFRLKPDMYTFQVGLKYKI